MVSSAQHPMVLEQFALFQHFPWRIQGEGQQVMPPKTVKGGGQTMVSPPKALSFLANMAVAHPPPNNFVLRKGQAS